MGESGTIMYAAPEVFARVPHGNECDWWSRGVILFEMLTGKNPFVTNADFLDKECKKLNEDKICDRICASKGAPESLLKQNSAEAKSIVNQLLTNDRRKRLVTANRVLGHPFFVKHLVEPATENKKQSSSGNSASTFQDKKSSLTETQMKRLVPPKIPSTRCQQHSRHLKRRRRSKSVCLNGTYLNLHPSQHGDNDYTQEEHTLRASSSQSAMVA